MSIFESISALLTFTRFNFSKIIKNFVEREIYLRFAGNGIL